MKLTERKVLLAILILILLLVARWGFGVPEQRQFTLLHEAVQLEAQTVSQTERLGTGYGLMQGPWDVRVGTGPAPGADARMGHYWAGGVQVQANGQLSSQDVVFRSKGYVELQPKQIMQRVIHNRFGMQVLEYRLSIHGAVSTDGGEYCLRPMLNGGGDAGYSAVAHCRYRAASRLLEIDLRENVDGTTRRYTWTMELDAEGKLSLVKR